MEDDHYHDRMDDDGAPIPWSDPRSCPGEDVRRWFKAYRDLYLRDHQSGDSGCDRPLTAAELAEYARRNKT